MSDTSLFFTKLLLRGLLEGGQESPNADPLGFQTPGPRDSNPRKGKNMCS